jgi:hypothetical protein
MKRFFRLVATSIVICFLISCATTESTQIEQKDKTASAKDGLFDEWNDASIENLAVAKLIKQADIMMKYKQWGDAQGKLERTLRVSITYAPAWSRLSWLSLRAAKHNKAIQLAHRSNSYTSSRGLQRRNWTFIRDANKLMGNSVDVEAADKIIKQLEKGGVYPQGATR